MTRTILSFQNVEDIKDIVGKVTLVSQQFRTVAPAMRRSAGKSNCQIICKEYDLPPSVMSRF